MAVSIGPFKFNEMRGNPPMLSESRAVLYTRPGIAGVGARVQPTVGHETDITVMRVTTAAARVGTLHNYRAAIGSVFSIVIDGVNYTAAFSLNFLILGVEILETRPMVRSIGIDPDGVTYDYAPAGLIVSRWRIVAVPSI